HRRQHDGGEGERRRAGQPPPGGVGPGGDQLVGLDVGQLPQQHGEHDRAPGRPQQQRPPAAGRGTVVDRVDDRRLTHRWSSWSRRANDRPVYGGRAAVVRAIRVVGGGGLAPTGGRRPGGYLALSRKVSTSTTARVSLPAP